MNEFLVDTNVILDVIGADEAFGPASRDCLTRCASAGVLVINPAIYAEVGALVETIEELNELLPTSRCSAAIRSLGSRLGLQAAHSANIVGGKEANRGCWRIF